MYSVMNVVQSLASSTVKVNIFIHTAEEEVRDTSRPMSGDAINSNIFYYILVARSRIFSQRAFIRS